MKMHLEKFKAIVHFTDGSTLESDEFYTDIHCRQFAEQFLDDGKYNGYKIEQRMAYEEVDMTTKKPIEHPVHFPEGGRD